MPLLSSTAPRRDRLPARLTAFGILYCGFHVGTAFLKVTYPPGVTLGDMVSLMLPWAVMGSALLVWDDIPEGPSPTLGPRRLLLASAVGYATGFGINLAANAIGRQISELSPEPPAPLTYFLDEHLGHVLWHLGMVGVTLALCLAARALPAGRLTPGPVLGAAGYALAYFTEAVEGQTVALLLPVSVGFVVALLRPHSAVRRTVVGRFILLAHLLVLGLFGTWAIWQHGFPQFSEVWGV